MRIRMPDESDVQPLDPEYAAAERFVDSILRAAEPKTSERGVRLQEGVVRCARGRVATRRGLVVALVATVAAGCGGSAHKKNIANPRPISFRDSRGSVNGVVYGGGERGIVLANQSDSDRTAWAPFGRLLAKRGYHVLAFDYGFDSPQSDIAAAARALRRLGAPVYRYGDQQSGPLDGAVFVFAQATDPELLLLLEARMSRGTPPVGAST